MLTAGDIAIGDEWKEPNSEFDKDGPLYWYGEVVAIHKYDPYLRSIEIDNEDGTVESRLVAGHQWYLTFIIRQASAALVSRSFWNTDVVERFYNGKSAKFSATMGTHFESSHEIPDDRGSESVVSDL